MCMCYTLFGGISACSYSSKTQGYLPKAIGAQAGPWLRFLASAHMISHLSFSDLSVEFGTNSYSKVKMTPSCFTHPHLLAPLAGVHVDAE